MAVVADLATLKRWVGAVGSADDANLQMCLDQATSSVTFVVYPQYIAEDEVQGAMLDTANRWYQRRRSPEGVAGFSEFGVVRVTALDPDIRRKLRPYIDMTKAGVAWSSPISEACTAVAAAITSVPCYAVIPGDVAHIPCAVIAKTDGERTMTHGSMWTFEHTLLVIGRSYDMDEVHTELADVTWDVIAELDAAGLPCNTFTRTSVQVGGHDQPANELPVLVTINHCP